MQQQKSVLENSASFQLHLPSHAAKENKMPLSSQKDSWELFKDATKLSLLSDLLTTI